MPAFPFRPLLCAAVLLCSSPAVAYDELFVAGFDDPAAGPLDDLDAARFLTQATFGTDGAGISRVRALGYRAWLDEQVALPPSLHLPYVDALAAAGEPIYQNARQEAWWLRAVQAPDQLRQRVAFALSELFVVSDRNGAIENEARAMTRYYDLLVAGALGNYRDLLEDVTLSPVMGHYLSMFRNRKPDAVLNIRPDENYAREIMQLFSVGLVQLDPGGTPLLSAGQPVPTYSQETIRGFAHAFTGWNWKNCSSSGGGWEWCPSGPVDWPDEGFDAYWTEPMEPWDDYHASTGSKQLLVYPGVALPGGVLAGGGTARGDLAAALDNLFRHPNVGPFVAKHLIRRLVGSNPSPAYVRRVAQAFADDGHGVRGNLAATVRAVLLDPEARQRPGADPRRGKLREPLLRLTHLWRAFDGRADNQRYFMWNPEFDYAQAALRSPSVFNFFLPDYRPPGELTQLGLDAPEFQITTDTTVAGTATDVGWHVYDRWRGVPWQQPETVVVDLEPELVFAGDPAALVARYDRLLMNGLMSPAMAALLRAHLQAMPAQTTDERRRRVQDAVWLILSSPEYAIER